MYKIKWYNISVINKGVHTLLFIVVKKYSFSDKLGIFLLANCLTDFI